MKDEEQQRLMSLYLVYEQSKKVCNPIEFQSRQQALLEKIAEYLLMPLEDAEKELQGRILDKCTKSIKIIPGGSNTLSVDEK